MIAHPPDEGRLGAHRRVGHGVQVCGEIERRVLEAHADAVVWLEETADGRPYRLLAWEPAPLRVEERP